VYSGGVENVSIPQALLDAAARLPSIYSDPPHYDLLAQMTAPADLPFYRALVAEHGAPVLELGAGTGRVALELAKDGTEVVGVELSPHMLQYAQSKAEQESIGLTLALGDIRKFNLRAKFPLILLTYNTFNHLLDLDSILGCLDCIREHMNTQESRLVIDTFQPSLTFLGGEPQRRRPILRYVDPYTKEEVVLHEENHYEPATQLNRIVWSYTIGGKNDARIDELTMRLFFPNELDTLLLLEGFAIETKMGDYDGRPFGSTTPKQLMVCKLAT
jgi:SAM-dependent methyltransferase